MASFLSNPEIVPYIIYLTRIFYDVESAPKWLFVADTIQGYNLHYVSPLFGFFILTTQEKNNFLIENCFIMVQIVHVLILRVSSKKSESNLNFILLVLVLKALRGRKKMATKSPPDTTLNNHRKSKNPDKNSGTKGAGMIYLKVMLQLTTLIPDTRVAGGNKQFSSIGGVHLPK